MLQLILVRHAKSPQGGNDFDRALLPKGIEKAGKQALWLKEKGMQPQMVLVSSSQRTRLTFEILAKQLPKMEVQFLDSLYLSDINQHLSALMAVPSHINRLMLVGHNYTISDLAEYFLPQFNLYFKTGSVLILNFEASNFQEILESKVELEYFEI